MSRVISLLVTLAHLGAASIPCYEGEPAPIQSAARIQPSAGNSHHGRAHSEPADAHHAVHLSTPSNDPHPHPAQRVPIAVTLVNHGGEHEQRTSAQHGSHRQQTTAIHQDDPHADHESPPAQDAHHRHANAHSPEPKAVEAHPYELRAPCLCGCTKAGGVSTSASSPRIGFALFPPKPAPLPEITPRPSEVAGKVMPGRLPDSLDHVPIPS